MSHSGSHTPTNNPTISNINNPQSSASRAQILDDIPSAELLLEDLARPPVTPPSLEPQIAESSSKRRTASESSTEKPMAKRIRRESPETQDRARHHDSSSSDLQDESDEMVEEKGKREPLASTTTPPKKKRTRTLTTPQQFAVLQALLAKSRFPTTAMREDVGRSIGLSARKVQIWFQNQRQKARRPRSQSDTPLTRPPQYGPFPNVPGPSSSSQGFGEYPPARMPYTAQSTVPEVQPSQSDTPARLLGPGMPGPSVYTPHPYQPMAGPSTSAIPIESRFPGSHPPRRSESPRYYHSRSPRAPFHTSVRYPTSQPSPSHWHRRERDPLRTLPPLVPSSSYSTRRTHAPSSSLPSRLTHNLPYPISPEPRFTRHVSPEIPSRPGITLPPPFAMQPSPQYNPSQHPTPFRSEQRPVSSPWSRRDPRSTIERSIPTVTARRERIMEISTTDPPEAHQHPERAVSPSHSASSHSMPPSSSLPLSRIGRRYDPVRATYITRSSPTPTATRARSPAQQSGEDNEEEIKNDRKPPISPKEDH